MLLVSFTFLLCMLIKNRQHILHETNNEAWPTHREEQLKDVSWSLAEFLWEMLRERHMDRDQCKCLRLVTIYNNIRWKDSSFTDHDFISLNTRNTTSNLNQIKRNNIYMFKHST